MNQKLLVLPDGSVNVPMVGTLQASGRSVDELRTLVTQGMEFILLDQANGLPVGLRAGAEACGRFQWHGGPNVGLYHGPGDQAGEASVRRGTTLI